MSMETAQAFIGAIKTKKIDEAMDCLEDDAILHSSLGPKHGKKAIRPMLGMIMNMGGRSATEPSVEDGEIVSRAKAPIGKVKMTFEFSDANKISQIKTQIGG